MAKKTFKIGEYCKGGIITVEITGTKVAVIGKEWDYTKGSNRGSNQTNAKEWTRLEVNAKEGSDGRRKVDFFLNDLTSCYYSGEVLKWIESKVEFKSFMDW